MDPIITPTALALAGGGWFAAKVLGPASDEVGNALRQFVNLRISQIFERVNRKVEPTNPQPLPPGFLLLAAQKASFSEDNETLTDMWASLLADASEGVNHAHAVYADILTQLGADEAKLISKMVSDTAVKFPSPTGPGLEKELYDRFRLGLNWSTNLSEELAKAEADRLINFAVDWPVIRTSASFPYEITTSEGNTRWSNTKVLGDFVSMESLDILCRQRLLREFNFDFQPGWASPDISGAFITMLGISFVSACNKPDRESGE